MGVRRLTKLHAQAVIKQLEQGVATEPMPELDNALLEDTERSSSSGVAVHYSAAAATPT